MNTTTNPTTTPEAAQRPQLVAVKNLKVDALTKMREPFPAHQISKLPKPYQKDAPKSLCPVCHTYHGMPAVHLDYVGHAAITHRLLDADPLWSWEALAYTAEGLPAFDKDGGLWIKLTIGGVTRIGYGNAVGRPNQDIGARVKEVIGDALRNGSMRFGAALELWHKGDLYGPDGRGDLTIDDDGVITGMPEDGNTNGAAPAEQRTPSAPPPGRKSAAAAKRPAPAPAASAASGSGEAISAGQMKNLLVKVKSLDMTEDMVAAMLNRLGVRAIDLTMSLDDWKKVKADLDAAARLV